MCIDKVWPAACCWLDPTARRCYKPLNAPRTKMILILISIVPQSVLRGLGQEGMASGLLVD